MSSGFRLTAVHVGAARSLLRMSQAELAEAAGVSESTVRKFEAGLHEPRPATLAVIRQAFEDRGIEFYNGGDPGVRLFRSKVKPSVAATS